MKLIIASAIAFSLAAIPAQARVPVPVMKVMGEQFYSRCTNPPPGQQSEVVTACEAYVAGISDGLQAAGKVCVGPRMTAQRLFPVALLWIQSHMSNGGNPASLMISNGLVNAFPCRATNTPQPRQATADEQMEQFEKIVKFMAAAKSALVLLGL